MRIKSWFWLILCARLVSGHVLAEKFDYTDARAKPPPHPSSQSLPASVMEKSPSIARQAKKDLVISPSGMTHDDSVNPAKNFDPSFPGREQALLPENVVSLVQTAERTMDNARPVIEAGQVFIKGIGGTSYEFVGLENTLKQVLETLKEDERPPLITSNDVAALAAEVAAPAPVVTDGATNGARESNPGMGGGFGVGLVVIFVLFFGVGIVMKK